MRRHRILIAAVSAGIALVGYPFSASGYWGSPGTGAGLARTTTALPVTISAGTPTQPLFPTGLRTSDVGVRLTNPNAFPIVVSQLALDPTKGSSGFAVDAAHSACPVASLSYATQTNGGAGWTVPGAGSLGVDLTNSLSLAAAAPSSCQGASFTVYLTS